MITLRSWDEIITGPEDVADDGNGSDGAVDDVEDGDDDDSVDDDD